MSFYLLHTFYILNLRYNTFRLQFYKWVCGYNNKKRHHHRSRWIYNRRLSHEKMHLIYNNNCYITSSHTDKWRINDKNNSEVYIFEMYVIKLVQGPFNGPDPTVPPTGVDLPLKTKLLYAHFRCFKPIVLVNFTTVDKLWL